MKVCIEWLILSVLSMFLDILRHSLRDSGCRRRCTHFKCIACGMQPSAVPGCCVDVPDGLNSAMCWLDCVGKQRTACGACVWGWPSLRLKTAALLLIKATLQILPSKNLLPVIFCSSE